MYANPRVPFSIAWLGKTCKSQGSGNRPCKCRVHNDRHSLYKNAKTTQSQVTNYDTILKEKHMHTSHCMQSIDIAELLYSPKIKTMASVSFPNEHISHR